MDWAATDPAHRHSVRGSPASARNAGTFLNTTSSEQIAQIFCLRVSGVSQQRSHPENLLNSFQRGTMRVVNRITVRGFASTLSKRRQEEHGNGTICELVAIFGFIPDNDQRAIVFVCIRLKDYRHIFPQPLISARRIIAWLLTVTRGDTLVAIMAQIRDDEVVARLCMISEIRCQIVERHDVCDTFRRLRIQVVVYVIEIHLREVLNVEVAEVERTVVVDRTSKIRLR